MGQLVMSFRGLWMHVTDGLPEGVQHRVVAVNANNGFQGQGLVLPPHQCYLEISSDISAALQRDAPPLSFDPNLGSTGGMRFDGYRLTVANATPTQGLNVDVIELSKLTDYHSMTLRTSITTETGAPSWADCYVDINLGRIKVGQFDQKGFYTTWTVDTTDDPVLQLNGPGGIQTVAAVDGAKLSTPPGLTLSDGVPGSIVLHNSTIDLTDGQYDFALYFLASTNGIPSPLPTNLPGEGGKDFDTDMTPSCSNSRYP